VGYELRKPSDPGNSVVLFLFGVFLLVVTNTAAYPRQGNKEEK
jgi:hypothetical protein